MATAQSLVLRPLEPSDSEPFDKSAEAVALYLEEHASKLRWVCVAEWRGDAAGHVTLLWEAADCVLRADGIPEVYDLKVIAPFRGRGIGSALLDAVEAHASTRSESIGLNVGLHSGYGAAQRLYVRRGYIPDGSGLVIDGVTVEEGATVRLMDDDQGPALRMTKRLG